MSASPTLISPLLRETLISLGQAARKLPAYRGSRCNPSTVFRWITKGVKLPDGHILRLDGIRLVGRWLTSAEALDRFLSAQHAACAPDSSVPQIPAIRTPTQRQRAAEAAARRLEELGI